MLSPEQIAHAARWNPDLAWMVRDDNPDAGQREAARRIVLDLADVPHDEPQYPPVTTQLANAGKALVRAVASGFSRVTAEEHERRRAICEACEYYDDTQERCRRCGCAVAIKSWLNSEVCPIGLWAKEQGK